MKTPIAAAALALTATGALAQDNALARVAPALEAYTTEELQGRVWLNEALAPRDRALITFAAAMTRHETALLPGHITHALDAGVTPAEVSETITHLAFYVGWPKALSAMNVAKTVFQSK